MADRVQASTNKAWLINSAGKIPANAANLTMKSQHNSQFFGQRRTKNIKYKNEFIRNQKNLQANGQNLGKIMKLNQAVDDHKSETRKYGYNLIDSDQIKSNKYGDGSGYNKLTNTAFRGIKTQKDLNKVSRDSRIGQNSSKVGNIRMKTSSGPRWIEAISRSDTKDNNIRKTAESQMDNFNMKGEPNK